MGAAGVALALAGCGGVSSHTSTATAHDDTAVAATATSTEARFVQPPAAIAAIQLFQPMARYTEYVESKLARLHPELATLDRDLAAGDAAAAERGWLTAHRTYLEIGQDDLAYGAFGELGGAIDGNAEGLVHGVADAKFSGFHRVELDLFRRRDLSAATADATRLTGLVNRLTPTAVSADLQLNAASLDAWVLRTPRDPRGRAARLAQLR